jgi:hypothetical protein
MQIGFPASEELYSDMSWALYMYNPDKSQVYQGWWGPVPIGQPPPAPEDEYQKWNRIEWEKLGEGYSLYDALTYVILEQTEFGPDDPVNNYRIKGQGKIWGLGTHSRGLGAGGTIEQALMETDSANMKIRQALWGEDAHRIDDGSGYYGDEDNNLVYYGAGNIGVMKLEPN